MIRVSFLFDAVTHAQLRKIKPRGFWFGALRGWEFPLAAAKPLQDLLGHRFKIKDDLSQWLCWLNHPLPPMPVHRELMDKADLKMPLLDGHIPLPHQRTGARWLLGRRTALLADEMGLGKTLTALLAARAMIRVAKLSVQVVAPVGLHSHWQEEAGALGIEIDLFSWSSLPKDLSLTGSLLVVDEAHFAQSLKARRTQSFLRLARHPLLSAIWLITGTPMKNGRPQNLYPLLAALDSPLAADQRSFEKYFCQGHDCGYGSNRIWNCQGASNLNELSSLVRPLMMHRCKSSCFGLPPKIRKEHLICLSKSRSKGFDHRVSLCLDDYRMRVKKGLVTSEAETLAVITALRQISSEFKLLDVNTLVKKLIKNDYPVVIFSSFVLPLKLLNNYLGGVLFTGKQSLKQRDIALESFQKGETNLLLSTYRTGGYGYSFHRARNVVLLDRPWTPGDVNQAEDRCHRLGTNGTVTSHWFKLGFIDNFVDQLLIKKMSRINSLMRVNYNLNQDISFSKMFDRFLQES